MKSIPILIWGLSDTAIMTARCLNKGKIEIFGMDYDKEHYGFSSRIIKSIVVPNPKDNETKWIKYILEWLKESNQKFILIPTSDEFVELTAKYYDRLSKYCLAIIPFHATINNIIERNKQFESAANCGLNVPYFITGNSELNKELKYNLKFPLAVKPVKITEWKRVLRVKGFIVQNKEELTKTLENLDIKNVRYLIQNIIEGDNTLNYEVNSLYLPDGKLIQHSIRKIRQYPDRYGTATCIEQYPMPELEKYAETYIRRLNLLGFSNIEFKQNPSDNKYYYIETNTRVWLQINFSMKLGINFPMLYYNNLTGERSDKNISLRKSGKWVEFLADILYWQKYRKKYRLSLVALVNSWFPLISTGLFSFTDPLPFIKDLKILKRIKSIIGKNY